MHEGENFEAKRDMVRGEQLAEQYKVDGLIETIEKQNAQLATMAQTVNTLLTSQAEMARQIADLQSDANVRGRLDRIDYVLNAMYTAIMGRKPGEQ